MRDVSNPRFLNQWLCSSFIFAILLAFTGCTSSSELLTNEMYPVSWTREVHWPKGKSLEELKDLPVPELTQPEIGIDGVAMSKKGAAKTVRARTWREFSRYEKDGYEAVDNASLGMSAWIVKERGFVPFLEEAQPSPVSYVRNILQQKDILNLLPIELGPLVSDEEIEKSNQAIKAGKVWAGFFPTTKIRKRRDTKLELQTDSFIVRLRTLAFGDYNHDGFEDVLVIVNHEALGGTMNYSFLAVLTRLKPSESFRKLGWNL